LIRERGTQLVHRFDEPDLAPLLRMEFDLEAVEEEDSPYPEVRASVSNIGKPLLILSPVTKTLADDPNIPAMTIRMWLIGLLLCIFSG
jgi:hypothetical protein